MNPIENAEEEVLFVSYLESMFIQKSRPTFEMEGQVQNIRTAIDEAYPESDTAASDYDVEEVLDPADQPARGKLYQNRQYIEGQLARWTIMTDRVYSDGTPITLVSKPTASKLKERTLNPFLYRNIGNVGSLDDLASLLDAPRNWRAHFDAACPHDGVVRERLNMLQSLPDITSESDIQSLFIGLVGRLADALGVYYTQERMTTKVIVGGLLANGKYDIRSATDPNFTLGGRYLLCSEVKTASSFSRVGLWYFKERGVQVLSALYALNCPCFLFNQHQWKLFVENKKRNAIFTFPFGQETGEDAKFIQYRNSTELAEIGGDFLRAIAICLLSKYGKSAALPKLRRLASPTKTIKAKLETDLSPVPSREPYELRERKRARTEHTTPKPTAITGENEDGSPIWSEIRVVPAELVGQIEKNILEQSEQQKNSQLSRDSESTLGVE